MSNSPLIQQLLERNAEHAASHQLAGLRSAPAQKVAVVACMDARLDVLSALGLDVGDAHVIRNAGGIITDDVIRSLVLSQRRLGTTEIVLLHHTGCGVEGLDEPALQHELEAETGRAPEWGFGGFADAFVDVGEAVERLQGCDYLPARDGIRGFVYDINTGRLLEAGPPMNREPSEA